MFKLFTLALLYSIVPLLSLKEKQTVPLAAFFIACMLASLGERLPMQSTSLTLDSDTLRLRSHYAATTAGPNNQKQCSC